jgi:agmatinase
LCAEEARGLKKEKIETFWASEFYEDRSNIGGRADLVERLLGSLADNVYISLDVDVFDPSIMPATGTPEPGGLLWFEILKLLRTVAEKKKIVGLDLVELAPLDGLVHPQFMVARLLYKTWGYVFKA